MMGPLHGIGVIELAGIGPGPFAAMLLADMGDFAAVNGVYIEYFRVNPPVRAALAVSALPRPAARVEIKCSGRIHAR